MRDSEDEHALLMVGWPQSGWHLELVEDQQVRPSPTEEDLLVLYLDGPVPETLVDRGDDYARRSSPSRPDCG